MAGTDVLTRRLELLHDEYRELVNAALDEHREDIAHRISDEHARRATEAIATLAS